MGARQDRLQSAWNIRFLRRRVWNGCAFGLTAAVVAMPAFGASFGTFEARGMAMGGATVAAATPQQANFYNPSLIAFHPERAEESLSGRLYLPVASAQLPAVAQDTVDAVENDLHQRVTASIEAFNAEPGPATAESAQVEAMELRDLVDELADEQLAVEAFAGLSVAEPDVRGGGAFHLGARLIIGARADVTETDQARLDNYIDTFQFYIDEQTGTPPNPELFEEGGQLTDPTDTVESTVAAGAASIIEAGLSAAHQFDLGGRPVALGVTPKVMEVRVYRENNWDVAEGGSSIRGRSHFTGNLDLGLAADVGGGLRLGLAVKDVIEQSFRTRDGGEVRLRPRVRAGLALQRQRFQLGLDVDLLENRPLGFEQPVQEIAMGGELHLVEWLDLRLGYNHNIAAGDSGAYTAGLGLHVQRLVLDLAYSQQSGSPGAAMQLGFAF